MISIQIKLRAELEIKKNNWLANVLQAPAYRRALLSYGGAFEVVLSLTMTFFGVIGFISKRAFS
jgi:hypothetical protein